MEIIVTDTNIFIDLCDCGLLDYFFKLPYRFHTVDFVLSELERNEQRDAVFDYIKSGVLFVKSFSPEELGVINDLFLSAQGASNISFTDCSVLSYASSLPDARLLTGDKVLKNKAVGCSVIVSGVLFVFDELVAHGIITKSLAVERLIFLRERNVRLPGKEVEDRIREWMDEGPR